MKKKNKLLRFFWLQFGILIVLVAGVASIFYANHGKAIRELQKEALTYVTKSDYETFQHGQNSVIYDCNGEKITDIKGEKDAYYLTYEELPEYVKAAIISIEDKKFFDHSGVDFKAIVRAGLDMIENQKITQGASTITQQLARTIFLTNEKNWERKIEEIFIATYLERRYSKEDILEFYLNNIYFGNGYYGIEAAARGYFNKSTEELTLSESAFLCAIPNNPTIYNPFEHMDKTISRRDLILKNLLMDGKILEESYDAALNENIKLESPKTTRHNYIETFVYHCATKALMEKEGFEFEEEFASKVEEQEYEQAYDEMYEQCQRKLFTSGYRIYTSIDMEHQKYLQQFVDSELTDFKEKNDEGVYKLQASGVCIDNSNGLVTAIVGGRSQAMKGYTLNRAYQSRRQPGSAIKPLLVYTPALEKGYTPDSILVDEQIEGAPENPGKAYSGRIKLRTAVEKSKNVIAWKLLKEVTPSVGLKYLEDMHFQGIVPEDMNLNISVGGFTYGASALEMASGYATLANDGIYRTPTCIVRIDNLAGEAVVENPSVSREVYQQNATRMMTNMLETTMTRGTAKGFDLGIMPSAGKTGTTDEKKDGWFCGYTPYYTTAIWVGCDMPETVEDLSGSTYPAEIWQKYMKKIHKGLEPLDFLPYIGYNGNVSEDEPDKEYEPIEKPKKPEKEPEEEKPEEKPVPQPVRPVRPTPTPKPEQEPEEEKPEQTGPGIIFEDEDMPVEEEDDEEDEPQEGDIILEP